MKPDNVVLMGGLSAAEKEAAGENVLSLPVHTTVDLPVSRVLNSAGEVDLQMAMVLGWDKDDEIYFASSCANKAEMTYMLTKVLHKLMNDDFG